MDLCDIWTNISETVNAMSNVSMKDIYEVIYDLSVYLMTSENLVGHVIFLALGKVCYEYSVVNGEIQCHDVQDYHCQHEEADTRNIFHMNKILEQDPTQRVVVRCNDTDILVLLLDHCSRFPQTRQVWMDAGLSGKNTRRYIGTRQLMQDMDSETVDALPGIHALTGSDYTAAFMGKGKIRPFKLMINTPRYRISIGKLGDENLVSEDLMKDIESFVCALYGYPKEVNVDNVRYLMFQQKYAPKADHDPLDKIKGLNPSVMPPCHAVLECKIKRANFVAVMWKRAASPSPITYRLEGNGWILKDGKYQIK